MILVLLITLILQAGFVSSSEKTTVFAAASLTAVMEALLEEAESRELSWSTVLASSSTLARQIEHGAPADVYISANPGWMDYLEGRGLLEPGTRLNLLANRLVLFRHGENLASMPISREFDFGGSFEGRLAIADPEHVPVGIYAKQALTALGWWSSVVGRIAPAKDAMAALRFVDLGACEVGVGYRTDVALSEKVTTVATIPERFHEPIVYPVAVVGGRDSEQVRVVITFLRSESASRVFQAHGFTDPESDP